MANNMTEARSDMVREWKPERQIMAGKEFYKSEGSIQLRIDRFAEFVREGVQETQKYILGIPWTIRARPARENRNLLCVSLICNTYTTSQIWECQATYALTIIAQKDGTRNIIIQPESEGNFSAANRYRLYNFSTCRFLLDPNNGFIKDDTVIIQALVKASRTKLISGTHTIGNGHLFSLPTTRRWDFMLIIQGKKVYVIKGDLSRHSEYFKDQFTKHERIVRATLTDVYYDDFIELLCVISPTPCPITAKNVEMITELAFKFYMAGVLRQCEDFLTKSIMKFGRATSLLMAEWYGLVRLQRKVIEEIESSSHIAIMKSEYGMFSYRTKRMLFDKICSPGPVSHLESDLESLGFTISTTCGRATEILQKLASSACCSSDCVLVVENNRIPIHKMYLAVYSQYFTSMFQSGFEERNKDEVSLEIVGYYEILELLAVIYPTDHHFCITDANVGVILKMDHLFDMPIILELCKKQLQNSTQISTARKLWYAQSYNHPDLQEEYARKYKTMSDLVGLKGEPEFKFFDDKTRALILDSIIG